VTTSDTPTRRQRFPPWLKKRIPPPGSLERVRGLLGELNLATVCQSARCPNLCECFARGTATFMILGDRCTRDCGFCAVAHGDPAPPDPAEPGRVAEAAARLGLSHVVVTSVTRDDLPDGGAEQFRCTILSLRERSNCTIEVLTPDFRGEANALAAVLSAQPDVFNHNVETVARLYPTVRPGADYRRSLDLLARAKETSATLITKSGFMVGLGERPEEVTTLLRELRSAGCDCVTIGQYLRPTPSHLPVERFVPPAEFAEYEAAAHALGFRYVASGPFVRSSYHAGDVWKHLPRRGPARPPESTPSGALERG